MGLINYKRTVEKLGAGGEGPCKRTVEGMVKRGEFPAPIRVSPRRVMFDETEVDAWIESRRQQGGRPA